MVYTIYADANAKSGSIGYSISFSSYFSINDFDLQFLEHNHHNLHYCCADVSVTLHDELIANDVKHAQSFEFNVKNGVNCVNEDLLNVSVLLPFVIHEFYYYQFPSILVVLHLGLFKMNSLLTERLMTH